MVVPLGADTADFCPGAFLSSTAMAFAAGAGGVAASGAKDCGAGALASFTLAAIVETFAAAGCGIEAGAAGLGERTFLTSIEESLGARRCEGATDEDRQAPCSAGEMGDYFK